LKPKWVIIIIGISLVLGGLVGVFTKQVAAWLGSTVLFFAFLSAMATWLIYRRNRSMEEDVEGESIERSEEVQFQGAVVDNRDPEVRDRMIQAFIDEFHINRDKAENLFDAGYSRWSDFSEAIPEDLLMVEGINPTVARRIISNVRSRQ
jgi:hypothetical protein